MNTMRSMHAHSNAITRPAGARISIHPKKYRPNALFLSPLRSTPTSRAVTTCQMFSSITRSPRLFSVTANKTPSAAAITDAERENFSWTQCWYPVTAIDYLDAAVPTQFTILGFNLVVWHDGTDWKCFRDACPHRSAPLSEGVVVKKKHSKTLQCAYHGFEFNGDGKCVSMPQFPSSNSPFCAAVSYPTAVAHGLLFVWLQPGESGSAAAATSPLPEIPSTDAAGVEWFQISSWYVREMPVDYVALMENSADPSHVHFTHAGFIGAPDRAAPLKMHLMKSSDSPNEFIFDCDDPKKSSFRHIVLKMPSMLWGASEGMEGGELALLYFIVPVSPGRCRLFSLPLSTSPKFRTLAAIFRRFPWLRHLFNHTVAAQDIALLHRQGTNMEAADFPGWQKGFHLTPADQGVVVLRKWLANRAGGGVKWGPNVNGAPVREAAVDRESLFENYKAHTRNCPSCSTALKHVERGLVLSQGVGLAGLATAAAGVMTGRGVGGAVMVVVVLAWAASVLLKRLRDRFYHTHWKHSENKKLTLESD